MLEKKVSERPQLGTTRNATVNFSAASERIIRKLQAGTIKPVKYKSDSFLTNTKIDPCSLVSFSGNPKTRPYLFKKFLRKPNNFHSQVCAKHKNRSCLFRKIQCKLLHQKSGVRPHHMQPYANYRA